MRISDWSSDVCSSDLDRAVRRFLGKPEQRPRVDRPADGVIHVALDEGDVAERAERAERLRKDREGQVETQFDSLQIRTGAIERGPKFEFAIDVGAVHDRVVKDRKSTRLNSSHKCASRMQTSA